MNTAISTTAIATTAPEICAIALRVASRGDNPSSRMMRSTFSITTIASSTTMPIASTMPNSDSWLIENPTAHMPRKPPISATGITSVAIIVARKFCRNSSMTRNTSTTASARVLTTSSIEMRTNCVVSYGTVQLTPGGNVVLSSSSLALTALPTLSAFAPLVSCTPNPATLCPLSTARWP